MMRLEPKGKGHFEVEFEDEQNGIAIYDKTLTQAIELLAMVKKEVKSITWKEDK